MHVRLHAQVLQAVQEEIKELESKLERLRAVADYHREKSAGCSAIERLCGLDPEHDSVHGVTEQKSSGPYANMGQREAAIVVLKNSTEPLRAADIATAMIDGGYPCKRDDVAKLRNSLFTSMTRAPSTFFKVNKGCWGLVGAHDRHMLQLPTEEELSNSRDESTRYLDEDSEEIAGPVGIRRAAR